MITVAIADDQTLVRDGLPAILELAGMQVVAEAETGIEATRRIVRSGASTRVLILTTFDLDRFVYDAMVAGASGFLLEDAGREQSIGAVRIVASGDHLVAPAIVRRLIEQFTRRPPPSAAAPEQLPALSGRELEVLRLVARGMSNDEIASHLVIARATVKTRPTRAASSSPATGSRSSVHGGARGRSCCAARVTSTGSGHGFGRQPLSSVLCCDITSAGSPGTGHCGFGGCRWPSR